MNEQQCISKSGWYLTWRWIFRHYSYVDEALVHLSGWDGGLLDEWLLCIWWMVHPEGWRWWQWILLCSSPLQMSRLCSHCNFWDLVACTLTKCKFIIHCKINIQVNLGRVDGSVVKIKHAYCGITVNGCFVVGMDVGLKGLFPCFITMWLKHFTIWWSVKIIGVVCQIWHCHWGKQFRKNSLFYFETEPFVLSHSFEKK